VPFNRRQAGAIALTRTPRGPQLAGERYLGQNARAVLQDIDLAQVGNATIDHDPGLVGIAASEKQLGSFACQRVANGCADAAYLAPTSATGLWSAEPG
jgi:hypothetical protein